MDSDEDAEKEFEEKVFEAYRVGGTAVMDQYEAFVKDLLRVLREHRPHCIVFNKYGSEMCPSAYLTEQVESLDVLGLQRSLMMALVLLARKE